MNRMLAILVTVLAVTMLSAPVRAERDDSAAEKLGFKLSLQSYTYRAVTTFEVLERCQKFGIKYLEIYPGQKMKPGAESKIGTAMTEAETAELLAKAKECGVKIAAFGVASIPLEAEALKKHFDWAKKLGVEVLNTEVAPTPEVDKISKETGIKVALHNHPSTWPAEKVLEATKGLSSNCGACADTGHWLRAKKVPVENLKILEGRIVSMHFKDLNEKKSDVVFGTGIADVNAMMKELKRQKFNGLMSMEYEHGDVAHLDEVIPQCVAAFDKIAAEVAKD